jgi:hypothetical protein
MADHPAYRTYWRRKEMLRRGHPTFPVRRWWETEGLSEIETIYLDAVRGAASLLDVGAGDLRVMRKLQRAGFGGAYHTQDIGPEGTYTYRDLADVTQPYDAILCLDVLEHLPLAEGLSLLDRMIAILAPGGTLVLQTPNAAYLPDPRSWDMTHVQLYNLPDLHAFLVCEGLETAGYRVVLGAERAGAVRAAKEAVTRYVKRKILGCDFAQNIAVVARKPAGR